MGSSHDIHIQVGAKRHFSAGSLGGGEGKAPCFWERNGPIRVAVREPNGVVEGIVGGLPGFGGAGETSQG